MAIKSQNRPSFLADDGNTEGELGTDNNNRQTFLYRARTPGRLIIMLMLLCCVTLGRRRNDLRPDHGKAIHYTSGQVGSLQASL